MVNGAFIMIRNFDITNVKQVLRILYQTNIFWIYTPGKLNRVTGDSYRVDIFHYPGSIVPVNQAYEFSSNKVFIPPVIKLYVTDYEAAEFLAISSGNIFPFPGMEFVDSGSFVKGDVVLEFGQRFRVLKHDSENPAPCIRYRTGE